MMFTTFLSFLLIDIAEGNILQNFRPVEIVKGALKAIYFRILDQWKL